MDSRQFRTDAPSVQDREGTQEFEFDARSLSHFINQLCGSDVTGIAQRDASNAFVSTAQHLRFQVLELHFGFIVKLPVAPSGVTLLLSPPSSHPVPNGVERQTNRRFIPPTLAVRLGFRLGEDPRTTALDGRRPQMLMGVPRCGTHRFIHESLAFCGTERDVTLTTP